RPPRRAILPDPVGIPAGRGGGLFVVLQLDLHLPEEAHVVVGELVGHLGGPGVLVDRGDGLGRRRGGGDGRVAPRRLAEVDDLGAGRCRCRRGRRGARGRGRRGGRRGGDGRPGGAPGRV